jgi:hypothetical protein
MFFHRLGPGAGAAAAADRRHHRGGRIEHLGVFTETCDRRRCRQGRYWAEKAAKMPADGVVIAKEAFRLVEQSQAYQGEEVASYLFHAYGTNLQFAPGEFNFVKTRRSTAPRRRSGCVTSTSTSRAGVTPVTYWAIQYLLLL